MPDGNLAQDETESDQTGFPHGRLDFRNGCLGDVYQPDSGREERRTKEAIPTVRVAMKISVADTACVTTSEIRESVALVRIMPIEFAVLHRANTSAFRCGGDTASSISE